MQARHELIYICSSIPSPLLSLSAYHIMSVHGILSPYLVSHAMRSKQDLFKPVT